MRYGWVVGLLAWGVGESVAQEAASPADALLNTQAQVCVFEDEVLFVPLRETADGTLESLGEWIGWRVVEEDEGRITLMISDLFLQLNGANSLAVARGELRQGHCADQTSALLDYVAAVVGGEGPEGASAFRDSLVAEIVSERQASEKMRVQVEGAAVEDTQVLREALATVRARNADLGRQLRDAEARLSELEGQEP